MFSLAIPSMSCGHCQRTIEAALRRLDPDAVVDVRLAERVVVVETKRTLDEVKRALSDEGYDAA